MSGDAEIEAGAAAAGATRTTYGTATAATSPKTRSAPPDRYNLFLVILCWIGIGCLMPWNFFINATDYWMFKFRDVGPVNGSKVTTTVDDFKSVGYSALQLKWNSYLSMSNMIPNLMALFFNATMGHKFALAPRLAIGQIVIIVLFAATDAMTFVDTDANQQGFLIGTLVSVVFISAMVGMVQGGLAAMAAVFPPKYMGTMMQGQAVGGVLVAVLNILTILIGSDSVHSASWSFLIGTLFTISSLILYIAATKLRFYKFYVHEQHGDDSDEEDKEPLVERIDGGGQNSVSQMTTFQIVCKIWPWIVTTFVTFTVTLILFPSVCVLVESVGKGQGNAWNDVYFIPVACFLVYNLGDYIGRVLSTALPWPKNPEAGAYPMLMASIARIAFIPLFLFCNASPKNRVVSDVYFKSDTVYIVLMVLFSVSNGYIQSICLMFGPKVLSTPKEQSRAASILIFYLVFGLTVGALLSAPLLSLL